MTTTVLAYFPSPAQGVWYLGPIPIRAYALCIIAGIIVALVIGDRRWVARGGERGVIYDIALWAVPFGLIGGRLYHLITDWRTYFGPGGAGLGSALRIWEGGLGIWGAVALGGVGAWIACRRRGIPLPAFGDAVAPGIVLAQAIGRLGNYFNQELYGRETTVPWGMEIFYRRDPSGVIDVHSLDGVSTGQVAAVVHPTFLYELLWNVAVFILLIYVDRRYRIGHGRLFALYVAAYCVGRFWVELLRDDTATLIAGIRVNVFTATFVFIGAVVYMLLAPKGREDPATLGGTPPEESAAEELAEEFAEELVAVARGSGVVAAATVAGEHEIEDAVAAGDVTEVLVVTGREESTPEATAAIDEVDAAVEDAGDAEVVAAVVDDTGVVDDTAVVETVDEAGDSSEPEPLPDVGVADDAAEAAEVADDAAEAAEVADDAAEAAEVADDAAEAAEVADVGAVEVTEVTEVVDGVAEEGVVPDEAGEEMDEKVFAAEQEAGQETLDEAIDEAGAIAGELIEDARAEEPAAAVDLDGQSGEKPGQPGFGATLRRLLWGVRSGD